MPILLNFAALEIIGYGNPSYNEKEIDRIRIRIRFFLKDGSELVRPKIQKGCEVKKKN